MPVMLGVLCTCQKSINITAGSAKSTVRLFTFQNTARSANSTVRSTRVVWVAGDMLVSVIECLAKAVPQVVAA
jgi:hypothetical protein